MDAKLVSTKTHGVIDYLSVPLLLAAPRVLGWSPAATRFLTVAAAGTFAYSLLTRYELGAKPLLPMKAHLAIDAVNGATTMALPWLLGAALTTETEPQAVPVDPTDTAAPEALPSPS